MHQSVWCTRMGRMGRPWGFWHRKKLCLNLHHLHQGWMSESSKFPKVHAHFCSIFLNKAVLESQGCISLDFPEVPILPPPSSGCVTLTGEIVLKIVIWLDFMFFITIYVGLKAYQNEYWMDKNGHTYSYLPSHYITVTQFQYILTISIAWEFATN